MKAFFLVLAVSVLVLSACSGGLREGGAPAAADGAISVTSPGDGETVNTSFVTVFGTGPDGATITRDISLAADDHSTVANGIWSMPVELDEGENELVFRNGDEESSAITVVVTYAPDSATTEEPGATDEPAEEPEAQPAKTPKPVSFKGKGTRKTKSFTMHAPTRIDWTHSGSGNFIVSLDDSDNNPVAFLVNDIGKGKGRTYTYGQEGKVHFNVIGDGSWSLKASFAEPKVATAPVTFKGSTGLMTSPFALDGDATLKLRHKGRGNFIVTLINTSDGSQVDFIANEIGKVSGDTQVYGLSGEYALDVLADGSWSITIEPS